MPQRQCRRQHYQQRQHPTPLCLLHHCNQTVGSALATIEWCTNTKLDDAAQAAASTSQVDTVWIFLETQSSVRSGSNFFNFGPHVLIDVICLYAAQAIATPSTSQVDAV